MCDEHVPGIERGSKPRFSLLTCGAGRGGGDTELGRAVRGSWWHFAMCVRDLVVLRADILLSSCGPGCLANESVSTHCASCASCVAKCEHAVSLVQAPCLAFAASLAAMPSSASSVASLSVAKLDKFGRRVRCCSLCNCTSCSPSPLQSVPRVVNGRPVAVFDS